MRIPSYFFLLLAGTIASCNGAGDDRDLCQRTFEPYMDLISDQARNVHNDGYVDAMQHYSRGDYAAAMEGLKAYLQIKDATRSAWLYLACCQIALGQPLDAEYSIDRLETSNEKGFLDQCEWYTAVCHVCSNQPERALSDARAIAEKPQHTYSEQAKDLVKTLEKQLAK
jgi:thioredoxin-like negative regulator of GroEL